MRETCSKSKRSELAVLVLTTSLFLLIAWVSMWPSQSLAGAKYFMISEVAVGIDRMTAAARLSGPLAERNSATALHGLATDGARDDTDSSYLATVRSEDLCHGSADA